LAGHWGLNKLIVLYDSNDITLDGEANMTFTEDIPQRFASEVGTSCALPKGMSMPM
jgi:transketolase